MNKKKKHLIGVNLKDRTGLWKVKLSFLFYIFLEQKIFIIIHSSYYFKILATYFRIYLITFYPKECVFFVISMVSVIAINSTEIDAWAVVNFSISWIQTSPALSLASQQRESIKCFLIFAQIFGCHTPSRKTPMLWCSTFWHTGILALLMLS